MDMQHADSARNRRYTVVAHRDLVKVTLDIRRSEFIGMIRRVDSEDEARAWIDEVRGEHHAATHVVPAFVLGADRDVQRSSDDGEPAGTAGMPMIQALTNYRAVHDGEEFSDVSDICAIVVRYFGGVKLGAGGLVRAYSDTAVAALEQTPLIVRKRMLVVTVEAPHADVGRVENELRSAHYEVLGTEYAGRAATVTVGLDDADNALADFNGHLASMTAGESQGVAIGTQWQDVAR
ncbi:MAG: IMPACT family protein [Yaniella sp.]|uniref:IMPACT family protein n=2 Tax=Yaniella sp. TaxID=2773929 RepID=UPI002649D46C|nr:YigZ family protein [Yaniella sp.]MDN5816065.1 IMPACT family protein [Yaniella sp.]MDN5838421.1 IMPACT family protein [Yaniella sp.]MDN6521025.1 IMPACT family protein [Yaniella sp.]MDN6638084.1 IMPACT family protein [Yaniella sp.]MDN6757567.1 IMPACT family protein [Yaniella sp.]